MTAPDIAGLGLTAPDIAALDLTAAEIAALGLIGLGAVFFMIGSIGIIRFPDLFSRLHALTKADNLGLALTAIGVALLADSWTDIVKLALVWFFVALASATCGHLIARHALRAARRTAAGRAAE